MLLQKFEVTALAQEKEEGKIQQFINAKGWEWYEAHKDDVLATFFFGIVTVKVATVRVIFEKLFGQQSSAGQAKLPLTTKGFEPYP